VIDVAGIAARKLERKQRKLKEIGEDPSTASTAEEEKKDTPALDPATLSQK
jgi:hypothetical protein